MITLGALEGPMIIRMQSYLPSLSWLSLWSSIVLLSLNPAQSSEARTKSSRLQSDFRGQVIDTLHLMRSVYEAQYAPSEWKRKFTQWDLQSTYETALSEARKIAPGDAAAARNVLKNFVYSMRDYHVSIRFFGTGSAQLPFSVRSAEGKVFIAFIDRRKLPTSVFPFEVGDELIAMGGEPVQKLITELQSEFIENVALTDRSMAENRLTHRRATQGSSIPTGPITVTILSKGAPSPRTVQLAWEVSPEAVRLQTPSRPSTHSVQTSSSRARASSTAEPRMLFESPNQQISFADQFQMVGGFEPQASLNDPNPFLTGTKKSFLPALGTKIWEAEATNSFDAYMYRTEDRKVIGVVRIPSYSLSSVEEYRKAVADFSKIINLFQAATDALVIDQLNNPGGSVFYLYTLASMLSNQALQTPKHRMALIPSDIQTAHQSLQQLAAITDDEGAKKLLGVDLHGYPVNFQVAQMVRAYYQFYIDEWARGKTLTAPYHIFGADQLNPYPHGHYQKPIAVLVNELCFSGGDFFPAILQDNKRAKIIGVRTSGAGGYVRDIQWPNFLGVDRFRVTASLAERVDLNPIENLGVTPDFVLPLTAEDLQNRFEPYRKSVKQIVESMAQ